MTSATSPISAVARAVQDAAERLRAQGWQVTIEPSETDLPAPLHGFRPDVVVSSTWLCRWLPGSVSPACEALHWLSR